MKRIIVNNVSKKFKIATAENQNIKTKLSSFFSGRKATKNIDALKDVSFSVDAGKSLGIIGRNGAGKSTLLRLIAEIYKPDKGEIKTFGKIIPVLGIGSGLRNHLTVRENIYLCCSLLRLNRKQIRKRYDSIVEFSELENFIGAKLHQLSSGMTLKLISAIMAYSDPDIILADEILVTGDLEFSKKCTKKIAELVDNGCTFLFITHQLELLKTFPGDIILIDEGKIIKKGKNNEVLNQYLELTEDSYVIH